MFHPLGHRLCEPRKQREQCQAGLSILTTQGDERLHHLVGHDDTTLVTTEVEVHVKTLLTVPGT